MGSPKKNVWTFAAIGSFMSAPTKIRTGDLSESMSDWNLLSRLHNIDSIKIFFSKTLKYFIVRSFLAKKIL